jgi:hypothetical protein
VGERHQRRRIRLVTGKQAYGRRAFRERSGRDRQTAIQVSEFVASAICGIKELPIVRLAAENRDLHRSIPF